MIAPARAAALDGLRAVHDQGTALPDVLAATRTRLADPRDVALASDLVIGTLRWRGALDHLIAARSSRPIESLDAIVLDILRLGAYQLWHLDRVPPSAVVHDAVSLTRARGLEPAAGFVNAVLRRLADPRTRPALPRRPKDADREAWVGYLATAWSHPRWLVARWIEHLGTAPAEARLRYDQSPAPVTLRASSAADGSRLRSALAAAGVGVETTRFAPGGLTVVSGNPWQAGVPEELFVVQDEASQLVAHFAGPRTGQRVLDVCAAPGGKATLMADLMDGTGLVVAADRRPARMRLLREMVRRCGARNIRLVCHDAAKPLPFGERFDVVLVDAPCSGLGTLRRDPDLKWRRRESDVPRLVQIEHQLLRQAARAVRPGGRLVYATCSSEPDENDHVARGFLDEHEGFRPEPPEESWRSPPLAELMTPEGWLRTLPERHGLDAFFAARFRRAAG